MASLQFRQVLMQLQQDSDDSDSGEEVTCPRCLPSPTLDLDLFRRGSVDLPELCLCKQGGSRLPVRRQSIRWADENEASEDTPRSPTVMAATPREKKKPKSILKSSGQVEDEL